MADNLIKTAPQNSNKKNIYEKQKLQFWIETLAITKQQLRTAAEELTITAKTVKKALME